MSEQPDIDFITWEELLLIHRDQLQLYGGQDGFIDQSIVESALNRPRWVLHHGLNADIADLAAEYLFGLASTQGFMDGNKRTATVCASVFLRKNGYCLQIEDEQMEPVTIAVCNNHMARDELSNWMRDHIVSRP